MNVRMRFIGLTIAAIAAFGTASCQRASSGAQTARENQADLTHKKILSMDDQNFLSAAYRSQMKQRDLAQAALDKSKSGQVVEFARQVVSDRNSALAELSQLMKTKQVEEPPTLAEDLKLETANRLERLSGETFNDEFISLIAAEQQAALGIFSSAAETAADPDIRNYASAILPSLRRDTDKAAALEQKLSNKTPK